MKENNLPDNPAREDAHREKLNPGRDFPELFKTVLQKVPAVIYLRDCLDGGIKWCNNTTEESFGYPAEEIIALGNQFWKKIAHPDDLYLAEYSTRYYSVNRPNFGGVVRLKTTYSDDWRWFVGSSTVFASDPAGRPLLTLVAHTDFTAAINTFPQIMEALREVVNHRYGELKKIITKREKDIIKMLIRGYSTPRIAEELHLSVHTVRSHKKSIRSKLHVKNMAELLLVAQKMDIN